MATPFDPILEPQIQQFEQLITNPPHYTYSSIEPINVIEAWELRFHLGCVVKYICRAGRKGNRIDDLKKARWYLNREIERLSAAREAG